MNVEVVNPEENIFGYLYQKLLNEGVDFSQNLIVFPGKRPKYFLLNEISKQVQKSFVPPSIFSMDEFIDFCYESELGLSHKKIDALSACKIIKELVSNKDLYKSHLKSFNTFLPLGFKLFSIFEELLIENVPANKLKNEDFNIDATYTITNLKRLSTIYELFYQNLENSNLSTRSVRYKKVSECKLNLSDYKKIMFAGFFGLTTCERAIFNSLMNDERVSFIFQGETAKEYALNKTYKPASNYYNDIEIFECPDTHSQVFKAAEILDNATKNCNETFLIILPSSTTLIPLINALKLDFESYNISLGYPLIRTPIFSFINHLFSLISSKKDGYFDAIRYLNFVLHPYTKNITLKLHAEDTRILFHTIEEHLNQNKLKTLIKISELEDRHFIDGISKVFNGSCSSEQLLTHIKTIHEKTIKPFEKIYNIKDFADKIKQLVNFIYEHSTAKKHVLFFPYCEALISALNELECSLIAEERFQNVDEYFDFFNRFISIYNVPFKGTPIKDIQVLGFLESRNLKFDNVYILDVNEGVLPNTQKEETILPYDVRMRLGLPTYKDRDTLYDYYLNGIIAGAKKVSIFYIENDTNEKSRFVEKIIWEKQKKDKNLKKQYFTPISYKFSLSPYKPCPVTKNGDINTLLKNLTYSASTLDTYYSCPVKFYYQYILMPSKEDSLEEGLESKDIGNIIHKILYEYYTDKKLNWDENKFNNILEREFHDKFGEELRGETLIIKYQIQKRIGEFIRSYYEQYRDSVEIVELEKTLEAETNISEIGNIKIKGRIDRLEKRCGELYIIDYKTAGTADKYKVKWEKFNINERDNWNKSFKAIQMMFYYYLLKATNQSPANASIILLGTKSSDKQEIKLFAGGTENEVIEKTVREDIENHIIKIIENLFTEIIKTSTFEPTKDLKECARCAYKNICWN